MMETYPSINGVSPKEIRGIRVPYDANEPDREFEGVENFNTHQNRAIYEFEGGLTVNIYPEFTESAGEWTPVWWVQVVGGTNPSKGDDYGPFETPDGAVQHVHSSLDRLA